MPLPPTSASPGKFDVKELLRAGAQYLREHPSVLRRVAINAAGLKITVPLDALRYLAAKAMGGQKKAPKDVVIEGASPALRVAASVDAMGTPIRFGASIKVDDITLGNDTIRVALRLADVTLRLEGSGSGGSPIAALIQSGALDLSKPGNLAKFMPNRPPVLIEAEDDRIVLDLMKDVKIASNPKVRRFLDLVVPVLSIRSIRTEDDALVIALRATPSGVGQVIDRVRQGVPGLPPRSPGESLPEPFPHGASGAKETL